MESMTELMQGVMALSARGGLLAVMIFAVQVAFRRHLSASWRYGLWGLLLVRLMLPAGPQSSYSMHGILEPSVRDLSSFHVPTTVSGGVSLTADHESALVLPQESPASVPAVDVVATKPDAFASTPEAKVAVTLSPWAWIAALWVAGAGWMLLRLAWTHLRLARAMTAARPVADEQVLSLLDECRATMGIQKPVRLVITSLFSTPALLGFVRPQIILPAETLNQLNRDELRMVFLHELGHLKRRDIPVAWVMQAVRIIHWFNPLVVLALRSMRREREMACDETVIHHIGDGRRGDYGRALLRFAERSPLPVHAAGLLGIGEERAAVARRIRCIGEPRRRKRPALAIVLLAILAAVGLTEASDPAKETKTHAHAAMTDAPDHEKGRETLRELARVKEEQMRRYAESRDLEIPDIFTQYLQAQQQGDLDHAQTLYHTVRSGIGQYKDTEPVKEFNSPLWMYIQETGGFEDFVRWFDDAMLERYRQDLFAGMPPDSIYFGGTDPGRFVATAFKDTSGEPEVHILTQNALADKSYMDYARERCGDAIQLPSQDEVNKAFQRLVADFRAGKDVGGAGITITNGKVRVQGVEGVMKLNAIISRDIFEANKEAHAFFVEESYVIPWMYPYLEPHGLILKLNPEPLDALPPDAVDRDTAFWQGYLDLVETNESMARNASFRKTLSKLRAAIAGLYAHRGMVEESERAFREALELYAYLPEAIYRLADLYKNDGRVSEARTLCEEGLSPGLVQPYGENAWEHEIFWYGNYAAQLKEAFAKNPALNPHLVRDNELRKMRKLIASLGDQSEPVDKVLRVEADTVEYNAETKEITALRNAVITNKDRSATAKGEKVVIKTDENTAVVSGVDHKLILWPDGKPQGTRVEYDQSEPVATTSSIDSSPKRVSEIVEVSSTKFRADFEAASLDIVLDSYGNACGRTMLLAPGIPDTTITLKTDVITNREFLYAVEESLRLHGIDLIADGDTFVKVVPIKNK